MNTRVFFWLNIFMLQFLGAQNIPETPAVSQVVFVAYGDVNLGRKVGQQILRGDIDYPFKKINFADDSADILFVNLESQLSNQHGETQHPKNNLIFTGPLEGAAALKNAGIKIVSTANNHMFDYGKKALLETMANLDSAGILYIGTAHQRKDLYHPLIVEENNIKFAIFAVTDLMNFERGWQENVAFCDTTLLFAAIDSVRSFVDAIIVSYHGGGEYLDTPAYRTRKIAEKCAAHGVMLFLGHHPHVSYGINKIQESYIVASLGNFVFYQPQKYWTQRAYGVKFIFEKTIEGTAVHFEKILPITASFQPKRMSDSTEIRKLFIRTQNLSNILIQ
ncbi:MAG: CapA family protein [Bacteroidetes bacterium]|nr:CapA family protein [Bacteroidota bacterium]